MNTMLTQRKYLSCVALQVPPGGQLNALKAQQRRWRREMLDSTAVLPHRTNDPCWTKACTLVKLSPSRVVLPAGFDGSPEARSSAGAHACLVHLRSAFGKPANV